MSKLADMLFNWPMKPSRAMFVVCWAFLFGVALASVIPSGLLNPAWLYLAVSGLTLILLISLPARFKVCCLMLLCFCLGLWRYGLSLGPTYKINSQNLWSSEAKIVDEPRWLASSQELIVSPNGSEAKIIVKTDFQAVFQQGQTLWLKCRLQSEARDQTYLKNRGAQALCYRPEISASTKLEQPWLVRLRLELGRLFQLGLNEPEGGLANAMIFGSRSELAPSLMKDFSRTGLGHLIAISGMNISLMIWLAMIIALALGSKRQQAFWYCLIFIGFYTILTGASASVVRAAVMGFLILAATQLGRLPKPMLILVVSASLMNLYDPSWLIFDLGFQLSFLAMIGLSYFYPGLVALTEPLTNQGPKWLQSLVKLISQILSATLAAQLATLPLLIARFGFLSAVSLPANLLTVWTMPFIMVLGLLAVAITYLIPSLALIWFLPLNIILRYLVWINHNLAGLNWAIITWPEDYKALAWLFYLPIIWLGKYLVKIGNESDKTLFI